MDAQMEAQELEVAAQTEPIETSGPGICGINVEEAEPDALGKDSREAHAHDATSVNARKAHAPDEPGGDASEEAELEPEPLEAQVNDSAMDEDETQLAAIRELMTRAGAGGIWLTLGEIAEATQFAEASISAQLRHLRKPLHGGHRVEKRRRNRARTAAARKIYDGRRGPVIWEYRVLPRAEMRPSR
jgi:hypothetical protein